MKAITQTLLKSFGLAAGLAILICSTPSHATALPNCWLESGQAVVDGGYIINVETSKLSKRQLVTVLKLVNQQYLVSQKPLVFDDYIAIAVDADFDYLKQEGLTRKEQIQTVEAAIEQIVNIGDGVTAQCNMLSYPAPAVGVRN